MLKMHYYFGGGGGGGVGKLVTSRILDCVYPWFTTLYGYV